MNEEHSEIIDWPLASQLAGNNRQVAEELLQCLIKSLPNDFAMMKQALHQHDYKRLQMLAHRLHGALCYCGLPRLKTATIALEKALKTSHAVSEIFNLFELEVQQVMEASSTYFSS